MSRPSYEQIRRSLSDLNACSRAWQATALAVGGRAPEYEGYLGSGMDLGLFAPIGVAYQLSCLEFAATARTADRKMTAVADTLHGVAAAYQADEDRNVHAAQGRW